MLRRGFLGIIVGLSFVVGVSAAPAQQNLPDCEPALLEQAFTKAYADASTRDRSLPHSGVPTPLLGDRYRIDENWSAVLAMRSGSLTPDANAAAAPRFWLFHTGTESNQPPDSSFATVQFPATGVTATVNARLARGAILRGGPGMNYAQVGVARSTQVLDIFSSVRVGSYDWLNVGMGAAWVRGDLVSVSDPQALATLRTQISFDANALPRLAYTDEQREARCPLPSALMVQTRPNTPLVYDFDGLTLLQNGATIITHDDFGTAATPARFFFTNVQGSLETVVPNHPLRITDPGVTFAVDFYETGEQKYVSSFTLQEQELGTAAWLYTCNAANLYDQSVTNARGSGLRWYPLPCSNSDTFTSLHPGWYEVLETSRAALAGAAITEIAGIETPAHAALDVPGLPPADTSLLVRLSD